ncbi:MAG: FAD-binding oxidoreductase, partial [Ilumatobacteraceae bacterium]
MTPADRTTPTSPIELHGTAEHLSGPRVDIGDESLAHLGSICETIVDAGSAAEASRDWWPLALHWSLAGQVPRRAAAVVRPTTTDQVAAVLRHCDEHRVPVTAAGGRSGVCGASVPVFGGVLLDLTGFAGIRTVDVASGLVEVAAGTFGPDMERELRDHGLTVGHLPQSFDLATVGGWVACRGAGQYSTRYGKIEHMVAGLEVVLANGRVVQTGNAPAGATGPDLDQVFIGSEGTLGVVTRVWLRAHPLPPAERRSAHRF